MISFFSWTVSGFGINWLFEVVELVVGEETNVETIGPDGGPVAGKVIELVTVGIEVVFETTEVQADIPNVIPINSQKINASFIFFFWCS